MNEVISSLRAAGNDVDGAIARFMGNEQMYVKFLGKLVQDDSFDKLNAALAVGDVEEGFAAAHTLKGVLGNLGLTVLLALNTPIVETLRVGEIPAQSDVDAFCVAYKETIALLSA